jgi:PadR family transcriptional regulator, regulatory protein PadR
MKSDDVRGHLDALILAALADSPAHGYSVIELIRSRSGGGFDLAEGTVYPALHRLEADGHLTSTWTDVNGRRRKIYSLTRPGRKQLATERDRWRQFSSRITNAIGGLPA